MTQQYTHEDFNIEKSKPEKKFKFMKFFTPSKEIREFVTEKLKQQGYAGLEKIPKYCGAIYAEDDGNTAWSTSEYYFENNYPEVKIIAETKYTLGE